MNRAAQRPIMEDPKHGVTCLSPTSPNARKASTACASKGKGDMDEETADRASIVSGNMLAILTSSSIVAGLGLGFLSRHTEANAPPGVFASSTCQDAGLNNEPYED
ncbi:uncharacterized protein LOC144096920 [Amblyomma americanum]